MKKFRVNPSLLIAIGLALSISFWLYSGQDHAKTSATASQNLTASHSPRATVKAGDTVEAVQSKALEQDGPTQEKLTQVRVVNSTAQNHNAYLEVSGETAFNRKVMVKSNIVGRVEELNFEKGALVREKDLIARLDLRDRTAQIRHWEALVALRKLQNDAAQKLQKKGFQSKIRMAESLSNLEAAKSGLLSAKIALGHTRISAPFAGVIHQNFVEIGDYVSAASPIIEIVDLDPLVIGADITEKNINRIKIGGKIDVTLLNGKQFSATIQRISPVAKVQTRTFRIEAEAKNPDQSTRAGLTANLTIPLETKRAHYISKSMLTLDSEGQIGLKIVDDTNHVQFRAIEIIQDTTDGMWVVGLEDRARIIIVGQEFVAHGQQVTFVEMTQIAPANKPRADG